MIAEARGGATFGKRLAGLRVTSVNDTRQRRLPIARAVIRTAVLTPALALLQYSSFSFGLTLEPGDGAPAIWARSRLGAGAIVPMVWLGIFVCVCSREPCRTSRPDRWRNCIEGDVTGTANQTYLEGPETCLRSERSSSRFPPSPRPDAYPQAKRDKSQSLAPEPLITTLP